MHDTLALLVSDILMGLGDPPREYLEPEEAVRAALHTLALYGLASQQSTHSRNNLSITMTLTARETSLKGKMQDVMLPSYVERKFGANPNEGFIYLHSVNLAGVEEARLSGLDRCCFYKDREGFFVLRTSYDPRNTEHRIWFYQDPTVAQTLDDPLPLPTRFGPMFVARGIIKAYGLMLMRIGKIPVELQPSETYFSGIAAIVEESRLELKEWENLWEYEKKASPAPKGRNRRSILASRRSV